MKVFKSWNMGSGWTEVLTWILQKNRWYTCTYGTPNCDLKRGSNLGTVSIFVFKCVLRYILIHLAHVDLFHYNGIEDNILPNLLK